jgi:hypothetical protein
MRQSPQLTPRRGGDGDYITAPRLPSSPVSPATLGNTRNATRPRESVSAASGLHSPAPFSGLARSTAPRPERRAGKIGSQRGLSRPRATRWRGGGLKCMLGRTAGNVRFLSSRKPGAYALSLNQQHQQLWREARRLRPRLPRGEVPEKVGEPARTPSSRDREGRRRLRSGAAAAEAGLAESSVAVGAGGRAQRAGDQR